MKIIKACDFLTNYKIFHKMQHNLYSKDHTKKFQDNMEERFEDLKLAFKERRGYIAIDDYDNPIGYIIWEKCDQNNKYVPNSIFISELYVFPENRRNGIGKQLVKHVLNDKQVKNKIIWLTHNPEETELTYFYNNFGFEVKGKTDVGNIIMIKNN